MRKQSVLMNVRSRHVTDIASVSRWVVNSASKVRFYKTVIKTASSNFDMAQALL